MGLALSARRGLSLLMVASCLLAGTTVGAEDTRLRALDAALAILESASSREGDAAMVAPLLAEMEKSDAARRTEFAAARAKRLGPKAADRLARA
ncbi:MAG TPA: hypothetical protein VGQ33_04615, partial [Vicinamibacteria bacterium]|nr:hypothetical protein [Vicinamibacteria bacterium]